MFKKRLNYGFTLIELLVVIAIIGILSSVVLVSLQSSRAKARDAKRIADIGAIQQALALYYDSNSQYPATLAGLTTTYLPVVPSGPNAGETYSYALASGNDKGLSYHLGATLEQVAAGTGVLANARHCNDAAAPYCPGFSGADSQTSPSASFNGTSQIYDITP